MLKISAEIDQAIEKIIVESRVPQKALINGILDLSDHYQKTGATTPWEKHATTVAYASYFFPLNLVRNMAVIAEAKRIGFFDDVDQLVDFGSGPGTTYFALQASDISLSRYHFVETSPQAKNLFAARQSENKSIHWKERIPADAFDKKSLFSCSYSLNELEGTADWLNDCHNLMIIEPSTQHAGRKLQELRQTLINAGFSIWAPCTHQLQCPLLLHSNKDWCHNRIHWTQPKWFKKIEDVLPIKNRTLTFSYLLATKRKPTIYPENTFRLTGDLLKEKGKTRIMACRGENREFLSWLKKDAKEIELNRGDLVQVSNFEIKGPELRGGTF